MPIIVIIITHIRYCKTNWHSINNDAASGQECYETDSVRYLVQKCKTKSQKKSTIYCQTITSDKSKIKSVIKSAQIPAYNILSFIMAYSSTICTV